MSPAEGKKKLSLKSFSSSRPRRVTRVRRHSELHGDGNSALPNLPGLQDEDSESEECGINIFSEAIFYSGNVENDFPIRKIIFHPSHSWLASASLLNVTLWDYERRKVLFRINTQIDTKVDLATEQVVDVVFVKNWIVAAFSSCVLFFNYYTGKVSRFFWKKSAANTVDKGDIYKEQKQKSWRIRSNKPRSKASKSDENENSENYDVCSINVIDQMRLRLAVGCSDGLIRIIQIDKKEPVIEALSRVHSSGSTVECIEAICTCVCLRKSNCDCSLSLSREKQKTDKAAFVSAGSDGKLFIWQVQPRVDEEGEEVGMDVVQSFPISKPIEKKTTQIRSIRFNKYLRQLFTTLADHSVILWNINVDVLDENSTFITARSIGDLDCLSAFEENSKGVTKNSALCFDIFPTAGFSNFCSFGIPSDGFIVGDNRNGSIDIIIPKRQVYRGLKLNPTKESSKMLRLCTVTNLKSILPSTIVERMGNVSYSGSKHTNKNNTPHGTMIYSISMHESKPYLLSLSSSAGVFIVSLLDPHCSPVALPLPLGCQSLGTTDHTESKQDQRVDSHTKPQTESKFPSRYILLLEDGRLIVRILEKTPTNPEKGDSNVQISAEYCFPVIDPWKCLEQKNITLTKLSESNGELSSVDESQCRLSRLKHGKVKMELFSISTDCVLVVLIWKSIQRFAVVALFETNRNGEQELAATVIDNGDGIHASWAPRPLEQEHTASLIVAVKSTSNSPNEEGVSSTKLLSNAVRNTQPGPRPPRLLFLHYHHKVEIQEGNDDRVIPYAFDNFKTKCQTVVCSCEPLRLFGGGPVLLISFGDVYNAKSGKTASALSEQTHRSRMPRKRFNTVGVVQFPDTGIGSDSMNIPNHEIQENKKQEEPIGFTDSNCANKSQFFHWDLIPILSQSNSDTVDQVQDEDENSSTYARLKPCGDVFESPSIVSWENSSSISSTDIFVRTPPSFCRTLSCALVFNRSKSSLPCSHKETRVHVLSFNDNRNMKNSVGTGKKSGKTEESTAKISLVHQGSVRVSVGFVSHGFQLAWFHGTLFVVTLSGVFCAFWGSKQNIHSKREMKSVMLSFSKTNESNMSVKDKILKKKRGQKKPSSFLEKIDNQGLELSPETNSSASSDGLRILEVLRLSPESHVGRAFALVGVFGDSLILWNGVDLGYQDEFIWNIESVSLAAPLMRICMLVCAGFVRHAFEVLQQISKKYCQRSLRSLSDDIALFLEAKGYIKQSVNRSKLPCLTLKTELEICCRNMLVRRGAAIVLRCSAFEISKCDGDDLAPLITENENENTSYKLNFRNTEPYGAIRRLALLLSSYFLFHPEGEKVNEQKEKEKGSSKKKSKAKSTSKRGSAKQKGEEDLINAKAALEAKVVRKALSTLREKCSTEGFHEDARFIGYILPVK